MGKLSQRMFCKVFLHLIPLIFLVSYFFTSGADRYESFQQSNSAVQFHYQKKLNCDDDEKNKKLNNNLMISLRK